MQDTPETNKALFERFIQLLNEQRLDELSNVVNPERYHEQCVGYAPGWMNLYEAKQNLRKVYKGIPDLHARIETMTAEGNAVAARMTITGTHRGSLFGAPATGRFFQVNGFDTVEVEEGKIVRRIQQGRPSRADGAVVRTLAEGLGRGVGSRSAGIGSGVVEEVEA